jgi:AcrR family transcriptional regulator
MSKLLKNSLDFTIFSEIYQKLHEPSAKRKALNLTEAAIICLSKKGFDGVTLEMIAREAAVTRPLIKHYFEDLEDLKTFSIKYIRVLFQTLVLEEMKKQTSPEKLLSVYVQACFDWVKTHRTHGLVWLAFMHRSAQNKKMRELNTVAVNTGNERIEQLIEAGRAKNIFRVTDVARAARMIQILITGALITLVSEEIPDSNELSKKTVKTALELAGFPS